MKKELYTALIEVQKELHQLDIKKDEAVQYKGVKYQYCSLPELLKSICPVLNKHGIYLDQHLVVQDGIELINLVLTHGKTGQQTISTGLSRTDFEDIRDWGKENTYKKRYMLMGKLGIFPDEDTSESVPEQQSRTPKTNSQYISDKQYGLLIRKLNGKQEIAKAIAKKYNLAAFRELKWKDFNEVLYYIERNS